VTIRPPIVVLGLGNELFTDEGVGVCAARTLGDMALGDVEVLDGGTLGLALLPEIEGRRGLLVLDAVAGDGLDAGEVLELGPDELRQPRRLLMSAHQVGVTETLGAAALMGVTPSLLAAVGMVPYSLATGYGLTPDAQRRLPEMVATALAVLDRWGIEVPVHA
jgi:hydrogenase maturation protease